MQLKPKLDRRLQRARSDGSLHALTIAIYVLYQKVAWVWDVQATDFCVADLRHSRWCESDMILQFSGFTTGLMTGRICISGSSM
jgi:hypothetical protein